MQLPQSELQEPPRSRATEQTVCKSRQDPATTAFATTASAATDSIEGMLVTSPQDGSRPNRVALALPEGVASAAVPFPAPHLLRMIERTFIDLPESDVAADVATMKRLRALPVSVVHGGHEPSFGRERLIELADAYIAERS